MVMRARKLICVIVYDIAETKRRNKVVKLLEKYGVRINYSVFECMLTSLQKEKLLVKLTSIVVAKEDQIAVYPICVDCYSKVNYLPSLNQSFSPVHLFGEL